jgi:hypothetical protein
MANKDRVLNEIPESEVPFPARKAMQEALFELLKLDNEWTTWSDAIVLAEAAATALQDAHYEVTIVHGYEPLDIDGSGGGDDRQG